MANNRLNLSGISDSMKRWIYNHTTELVVAAFLLFQLTISIPNHIYGYVDVWYVLDYSYGFGTRLMIGSLLHLFLGYYISAQAARAFLTWSLVVLCLLIAILSGEAMRHAKTPERKRSTAFFIALYLASPASPAYLWTQENFGRLETWLLILAILIVFVYIKIKPFALRLVLFFALAFLALLTHQVYFFLFFPSLCVLLIAEWTKDTGNKRRIISTVVVFLLIFLSFLYLQFFSGIYYDDLSLLVNTLRAHTDFEVSEPTLLAEYFWTLKDHFVKNQLPELRERVRFGIITIVLLAPMWLCILKAKQLALKFSGSTASKYRIVLILLTDIAFVPVFALMTDYGRWFAALFTVQFLSFAAFAASEEELFGHVLDKIGETIGRYPLVFLAIILYCTLFEKFEGINFPEQVRAFYYKAYELKSLLLGVL